LHNKGNDTTGIIPDNKWPLDNLL